MPRLENEEIQKILPHRYPLLLVDRILECDDKEWVVGVKNLTVNEPFFQGHFPGHPVMPGVLQLEAMAQVAGVLLSRSLKQEGRIAYFMAIDNARFRRLVLPGDQLRIEVKFSKLRMGTAKVHGVCSVEGEVACEAELMFTYK